MKKGNADEMYWVNGKEQIANNLEGSVNSCEFNARSSDLAFFVYLSEEKFVLYLCSTC